MVDYSLCHNCQVWTCSHALTIWCALHHTRASYISRRSPWTEFNILLKPIRTLSVIQTVMWLKSMANKIHMCSSLTVPADISSLLGSTKLQRSRLWRQENTTYLATCSSVSATKLQVHHIWLIQTELYDFFSTLFSIVSARLWNLFLPLVHKTGETAGATPSTLQLVDCIFHWRSISGFPCVTHASCGLKLVILLLWGSWDACKAVNDSITDKNRLTKQSCIHSLSPDKTCSS